MRPSRTATGIWAKLVWTSNSIQEKTLNDGPCWLVDGEGRVKPGISSSTSSSSSGKLLSSYPVKTPSTCRTVTHSSVRRDCTPDDLHWSKASYWSMGTTGDPVPVGRWDHNPTNTHSTKHEFWSEGVVDIDDSTGIVTNSWKKKFPHKKKSPGRDGHIEKGRQDVDTHQGADTLPVSIVAPTVSRVSGGISMLSLAQPVNFSPSSCWGHTETLYDVWFLSFVVQDRVSYTDRAVNFRWQITTDIGSWQNNAGNAILDHDMTRQFLTMPAASVTVELVFSLVGLTLSDLCKSLL
jgi:hypothetical protein